MSRRISIRHGWSSALTVATLACPEQTKSLALPADDRIRLDNHQRAPPFRPPAGQPSPKPTFCGAQSWSFHGSLQKIQLMTKSQDFNLKRGTATKQASEKGKQRGQNGNRRERTLGSQASYYRLNPNLRHGQPEIHDARYERHCHSDAKMLCISRARVK